LEDHFLSVPLVFFTTAVPLPFGALGLSEEAGLQLFGLVGHPGGALTMMAFRILMYGGGVLCAGVSLTNWGEVRALADSSRRGSAPAVSPDPSYRADLPCTGPGATSHRCRGGSPPYAAPRRRVPFPTKWRRPLTHRAIGRPTPQAYLAVRRRLHPEIMPSSSSIENLRIIQIPF
jgi:hypothetical protein